MFHIFKNRFSHDETQLTEVALTKKSHLQQQRRRLDCVFMSLFVWCVFLIRRMVQVFLFHIVWTLTVAMVTENDCQNRLK